MINYQNELRSTSGIAGLARPLTANWIHVALAATIMISAPSVAAENSMQGFFRCLEMQEDEARLACYDRLAVALVELGTSAAGLPPDSSMSREVGQADTRTPPGSPADTFGNERIDQDSNVDSITANVIGGFTGWFSDTVFKLDNGQAWQPQGSSRFSYGGPDRPVTIRRAAFGSFLLSPEGLNRSVRVQRVE